MFNRSAAIIAANEAAQEGGFDYLAFDADPAQGEVSGWVVVLQSQTRPMLTLTVRATSIVDFKAQVTAYLNATLA